jgi:surface polysaccharide O-acyltransferase-like enzyme
MTVGILALIIVGIFITICSIITIIDIIQGELFDRNAFAQIIAITSLILILSILISLVLSNIDWSHKIF